MIAQLRPVTLFAVLAACTSEAAPLESPREAPAAAPLEAVRVVAGQLDATATIPGELVAWSAVDVVPRAQGFVERVEVDRGSRVRRGELLVRLVAPELRAERAEAAAKAQREQQTLARLRRASQTDGAVAAHEVETAQQAYSAETARVEAYRALESYLLVRAPFDGTITARHVHPGALVGPSAGPMLRLEDVGRLRLTLAVPEHLVGGLQAGSEVSFTVRAWPERTFAGEVARVAASLDPQSRTMAVEVDVDNADGQLAPGMYADARWPVRRSAPALTVPRTAVVQSAQEVFVIRVRDGVAERVAVRRGLTDFKSVEVFGPLAAGEVVLARGRDDIRDGAAVQTRVAEP